MATSAPETTVPGRVPSARHTVLAAGSAAGRSGPPDRRRVPPPVRDPDHHGGARGRAHVDGLPPRLRAADHRARDGADGHRGRPRRLAARRRSRCSCCRLIALFVALAIDLPDLNETGLIGRTYDQAEARPRWASSSRRSAPRWRCWASIGTLLLQAGTLSTSLPRTWPPSRRSCASAARSSGKTSSTCGRSLPPSHQLGELAQLVAVGAHEDVVDLVAVARLGRRLGDRRRSGRRGAAPRTPARGRRRRTGRARRRRRRRR